VSFTVGCASKTEDACMGYQCFQTFSLRKDAIAAWNKRAPRCDDVAADEIERLRGDIAVKARILTSQSAEIKRLRVLAQAVSEPVAPVKTERRCQKCGETTKGEEALVDGQIWCHPCADTRSSAGTALPTYPSNKAREAAAEALRDLETNLLVDSDIYTLAQHMEAYAAVPQATGHSRFCAIHTIGECTCSLSRPQQSPPGEAK
jgi:hypothetical protein